MKNAYVNKVISVLLLFVLFGCSANTGVSSFGSLEEIKDKRIGIMTGTIYDAIVKERFPEAE